MKGKKGRNDDIFANMPPDLAAYFQGVTERKGIEALPEALIEARKKFSDWTANKRNTKRNGAEVETDTISLEEIEARDAADAEYDNAFAEVEKYEAGSPTIQMFSREKLRTVERGDVLRFDHSDTSWDVIGYDAKGDVLTVVPKGTLDNPLMTDEEISSSMVQYRVSEDGFEEVPKKPTEPPKPKKRKDDGRKDEGRTAETVAGNAQGASDRAKGGEEKSFKLESATAEEIKSEETRRKEREEIKKRQPSVKKSRVSFKNEAEAKKAAKALAAIDFMSEELNAPSSMAQQKPTA